MRELLMLFDASGRILVLVLVSGVFRDYLGQPKSANAQHLPERLLKSVPTFVKQPSDILSVELASRSGLRKMPPATQNHSGKAT
jgi:hypothetical protein